MVVPDLNFSPPEDNGLHDENAGILYGISTVLYFDELLVWNAETIYSIENIREEATAYSSDRTLSVLEYAIELTTSGRKPLALPSQHYS